MGEREVPFSKYYVEHEHMEAMRAAFHKVCDALLLNGDVEEPMTEIIVNKIVALAKAGEHDADRLAEHVLNDWIDDGLPPPSGKSRQDPSPPV
jgi:hypothetical protein